MHEMKHLGKQAARYWVLLAFLVAVPGGCGGSGGGSTPPPPPPPTATLETGRFVDAAVTGIRVESGASVDITDADGQFRYEALDGVAGEARFSFAGIVIGSANGKAIVTPLDFVPGSNIDTLAVVNISRFLQFLDADADPTNGIAPSSELVAAIDGQSFAQVNFADPAFADQLAVTEFVAFVSSVDELQRGLPSADAAAGHLRSTLACLSSGVYAGRFAGDDSGRYAILVQHLRADPLVFGDTEARPGVASALIYSEPQDRLIGVVPQQALAFDSDNAFLVGEAVNGAEFAGTLQEYEQIAGGTWRNDVEGGAGTFSGERVAGDAAAVLRLSGGFGDQTPLDPFDNTPDNSGGIALDVFADDTVTGIMVSARGDRVDLTGTLDGETINLTSGGGVVVNITLDRDGSSPISDDVGLFGVPGFWGTWESVIEAGGVGGTACALR
ncbi:MAG: hypothetical protein QNI99_12905 [Woeseiaceae bacterium]|nr:hypothetical protein [Woeseiaceae bacterium]